MTVPLTNSYRRGEPSASALACFDCISATMCNIKKNGTINVGISTR